MYRINLTIMTTKLTKKPKPAKLLPEGCKAVADKITYIRRRGLFQQLSIDANSRDFEGEIRLHRAILDAALVDALVDLLEVNYVTIDQYKRCSEEYNWFTFDHPEYGDDLDIVCTFAGLDTRFVSRLSCAFVTPLAEGKIE